MVIQKVCLTTSKLLIIFIVTVDYHDVIYGKTMFIHGVFWGDLIFRKENVLMIMLLLKFNTP